MVNSALFHSPGDERNLITFISDSETEKLQTIYPVEEFSNSFLPARSGHMAMLLQIIDLLSKSIAPSGGDAEHQTCTINVNLGLHKKGNVKHM